MISELFHAVNLPNRQRKVKRDFAYLAVDAWPGPCDGLAMSAKDEKLIDGSLMKSARKAADLSLESLGEKVGLSAGYLSRMERGVRNISIKHLRAIASALAVPPSSLVVDSDEDVQPEPAKSLAVLGEVRAGAWLEIDDAPDTDTDRLPEIARLKGEQDAIRRTRLSKRC